MSYIFKYLKHIVIFSNDVFIFAILGLGGCTLDEYRLVTDLLNPSRYDANVLPTANISEPVVVKVGMALNQIIDLVSSWFMVFFFGGGG